MHTHAALIVSSYMYGVTYIMIWKTSSFSLVPWIHCVSYPYFYFLL